MPTRLFILEAFESFWSRLHSLELEDAGLYLGVKNRWLLVLPSFSCHFHGIGVGQPKGEVRGTTGSNLADSVLG